LCGALVNDSKARLFSWSKLLKIKYREADYSKIICDMLLQLFKFDMHTIFLLFLIRTAVICSSINKLLQRVLVKVSTTVHVVCSCFLTWIDELFDP